MPFSIPVPIPVKPLADVRTTADKLSLLEVSMTLKIERMVSLPENSTIPTLMLSGMEAWSEIMAVVALCKSDDWLHNKTIMVFLKNKVPDTA